MEGKGRVWHSDTAFTPAGCPRASSRPLMDSNVVFAVGTAACDRLERTSPAYVNRLRMYYYAISSRK